MSDKKPDFSKPVDLLAFIYNEFYACGCSEIDKMVDEIKYVLKWSSEDIKKRINFDSLYPGRDGIFYLVAALLDKNDFIEHGTSIRGSLITKEGKEFLGAIEKISVDEMEREGGVAYDGCFYE